jgi:hypothetical protein
MLSRGLGAVLFALASGAALADSVSGQVALAPAADCQSSAAVLWSFTYTVNPAREFGRLTNLQGTVIGNYDQPSPLTGGTFTGTWAQPIQFPQPDDTLIGSYGGAGDNPPTVANTAEFFVLYNCTTRQVLYRCNGNLGTCPRTAADGLQRISESIPATSPLGLAALMLVVAGLAASRLRRTVKVPARV